MRGIHRIIVVQAKSKKFEAVSQSHVFREESNSMKTRIDAKV